MFGPVTKHNALRETFMIRKTDDNYKEAQQRFNIPYSCGWIGRNGRRSRSTDTFAEYQDFG
jgi:hypothetical protein